MTDAWELDGYIVVGPIVQAGGVDLWRARDRATGLAVALRRLPTSTYDGATVSRLLARLSDVPFIATARAVVDGTDATVVVHDLPAGGTLSGLLEARTHLSDGEVITIGVPLAQVLGAAHERGFTHGHLTVHSVVFDADGRPALLWPGAARPVDPAEDTRALRSLLSSLLGDEPSESFRVALDADGNVGQLARDLLTAGPATPVRLRRPRGRAVAARREHPAGRAPRRLWPVIAATVALVGAVATGVAWANAGSEHAPTIRAFAASPSTPSSSVDWRVVLQQLDARRDRAFVTGDVAALRQIYVPSSKALAVEEAALAALTRRHLRARGLRLTIVTVTAVNAHASTALLHVVDRLAAYDVVDARGRVAAHHEERGLRSWRMELTRFGDEWRIASVRAT